MPPAVLSADLADAARHLDSIWRSLRDASASRDASFRTPAFTTLGHDGSPQSRTVVLRSADAVRRELVFYSDVRAAKVAELRRDARATVVFYDAGPQVQLRVAGEAVVYAGGAVALDHWPRVPESNRMNYRTTLGPGTVVASPDALGHTGDGSDHFAVIVLRVARIEWLWLDRAGHKRCAFTFGGEGVDRAWLVP